MDSFHRADWLSAAQSIATLIAVGGAFGVVFYQRRQERKQRKIENAEFKKGICSIALRAKALVSGIQNGSLNRSFGVLEWRGENAYKMSIIRSGEALVSVCDLVPLDRLAEVESTEPMLYLREAMHELVGLFGSGSLSADGKPMGSAGTRFQNVINLTDRALGDLGITGHTILDMAKKEGIADLQARANEDAPSR
jgi:hypothetical protein